MNNWEKDLLWIIINNNTSKNNQPSSRHKNKNDKQYLFMLQNFYSEIPVDLETSLQPGKAVI